MIVDASVAIKWLAPEEDSDVADRILRRGDLTAPDLIACELSNAIWKKRGRGELTAIPANFGLVLGFFDSLTPMSGLMVRATEIAIELDHAAYDCFYLAQAERSDDTLVTADAKMLSKLAGTSFASLAVSLREAAEL